MSRAMIDAADMTTPQARMGMNTFNPMAYYESRVDEICRVGVPDAAAFLDEHIPGWHERVTRPITMGSVCSCVLGQVFGDPSDSEYDTHLFNTGYIKGVLFLRERGFNDRSFVFSSDTAAPYWGAEITRRSA